MAGKSSKMRNKKGLQAPVNPSQLTASLDASPSDSPIVIDPTIPEANGINTGGESTGHSHEIEVKEIEAPSSLNPSRQGNDAPFGSTFFPELQLKSNNVLTLSNVKRAKQCGVRIATLFMCNYTFIYVACVQLLKVKGNSYSLLSSIHIKKKKKRKRKKK